jgi:hypothetical protein
MSKKWKPFAVGAGFFIIILVGLHMAPLLKQRMLPSYATPQKIEEIFPEQLKALVEIAEGKKMPEQVEALFAEPAIRGAFVVNNYSQSGRAMTKVKDTKDWLDAERGTVWFFAEPEEGRAVVNIWGGRIAVFEKKFHVTSGAVKVKGCELIVDVDALKQKERQVK